MEEFSVKVLQYSRKMKVCTSFYNLCIVFIATDGICVYSFYFLLQLLNFIINKKNHMYLLFPQTVNFAVVLYLRNVRIGVNDSAVCLVVNDIAWDVHSE